MTAMRMYDISYTSTISSDKLIILIKAKYIKKMKAARMHDISYQIYSDKLNVSVLFKL